MKQKTTHVLTFLLSMILLVSLCMQSFAISPNSGYSTQEVSPPTQIWDWNDGPYHFSGLAYFQDLYSNYYFKNANSVKITVQNKNNTDSILVEVIEVVLGFRTVVSDKVVNAQTTVNWSVNLSPNRKYMLKFYAPCHFSGNIKKLS